MTETDGLLERVRHAGQAEDDTSERILDAALDRFSTFGIRRTTMDDISSAAGVGRATLYRRFAGRDEIVRAVILREMYRFISEVDASVQEIDDPAQRFVEGFLATMREARQQPLMSRLIEIEPDLLLPFLTVEALPALELARDYLAAQLHESQADGAIAADVDVDVVAEMLVRLCQSLLLTPKGLIDPDDEDGLRRIAETMFAPVLFS